MKFKNMSDKRIYNTKKTIKIKKKITKIKPVNKSDVDDLSNKMNNINIDVSKKVNFDINNNSINPQNIQSYNINTLTNKEQHWIGDEEWNIEIHYSSFYDTERQDICLCIQCAAVIMNYNTFKHKIKEDLYLHYNNFKYYGTPSNKYS